MRIKLTAKETTVLLDLLKTDLESGGEGMAGSKIDDILEQIDWLHTLAGIYRRLKRGRRR